MYMLNLVTTDPHIVWFLETKDSMQHSIVRKFHPISSLNILSQVFHNIVKSTEFQESRANSNKYHSINMASIAISPAEYFKKCHIHFATCICTFTKSILYSSKRFVP